MSGSGLCPECKSPYGYPTGEHMMCPECGYEWTPETNQTEELPFIVKDAHGTLLANGDSVIVLKNLPVKGYPQPIKAGTRIKNIRLTDGDHNIDCRIDGFGAMHLKSEFVRKG